MTSYASAITLSARSTVDSLVERLRSMILNGEFQPNQKIKESKLAREVGIARHTVRAALSALANEGLLVFEMNHGWSVPQFSTEDLYDITFARAALEVPALKKLTSARHQFQKDVNDALDELLSLQADSTWATRLEVDLRLHALIVDQAASPRLSVMHRQILQEVRLARVQSPEWHETMPLAEWQALHRDLVTAIESGNWEAVERQIDINRRTPVNHVPLLSVPLGTGD